MADEEVEAAPEAEMAPAPAPAMAPAAEPFSSHDVPIDAAQIKEIWASPTSDAALLLLARCLSMSEDDLEESLRAQIWLELLYGVIDHCKTLELTPKKAKAFLDVITALHGACVETLCAKEEAFSTFTDSLLRATKALPLAERFSLEEVRLLTEHVTSSYLSSLKLHQLVFTEEQTVRESEAELFLQTPAVPPPTEAAVDPSAVPPPNAEGEAADADAAAADADADPAAPDGEPAAGGEEGADGSAAEASAPAEAMGDEALTAAIAATISSQVAAHQAQMAAEFAAQEQVLLDRVAALETKLSS